MDLRKSRTRTLIQLGGLIEKSGMLGSLDLTIGDDLQKDELCFESVATLAGAFAELCKTLQEDETQKMLWREKGKTILGSK